MTEETTNTENAAAEEAPAQDIIRGRMPLPIVYLIKFDEPTGTDGEIAKKYRTTNGKISDIKKARNFGYITEDFKPTQDMVDAAIAYAEQLDDETVVAAVKDLDIASAEEAEAFAATRKRGPRAKPAEETETGAEEAGEGVDELLED